VYPVEKNILSSLSRLFRPEGYRILTAESAITGLEILEKENIDLIICDMRMPQMNGAVFLEQVAQRWPKIMRILLTGYADMTSTIDAINKGNIYSYVSKPWEDCDLKINVQRALEQKLLEEERLQLMDLTHQQNQELSILNATLEKKVLERTEALHQAMVELEGLHESLKKSYSDSIKTFSSIIEFRGGSTPGHARRVAELAFKLARQLGMNKADTQDVLFSALLHDIGKIGLPDVLLKKPFKMLSNEERKIVIKHSTMGEATLMSLDMLRNATAIIHAYNEKNNGSCNPKGDKGDVILLGAEVIAVANDYDSLQIGTLLPEKLTPSQARDFIVENRGTNYAPKVVDAFVEYLKKEGGETSKVLRYIVADDLTLGMVLGKDLVTSSGMVLLARGHVLDLIQIEKIRYISAVTEDEVGVYISVAE